MAMMGEWLRRVGHLFRRRAWEDELRQEMEAHRAQMGDARAFGNTLRLREEARDAWGWRWLDDVVQDTRFAWRTLRHRPGFALTAIVTLGLGIGVNSGMFSVVNGLLLRPLHEGGDELVEVHGRRSAPFRVRDFSYPNYRDLQEGTTDIFVNLAASSMGFIGLDAGDGPRRALACAVTANYFQVFGTSPAQGRPFTAEEERPGAGMRVAIVSHALWEQLGGDGRALGGTVRINGEPFTIVGVARKGFAGTSIPGPEIWLPLGVHEAFSREDGAARSIVAREAHELSVFGRLWPGRTDETAGAALATVGRRLEQAYPAVNAGYSVVLSRPDRSLLFLPGAGTGMFAGLALLLMLMPGVVLLVACLNLADLLLARGHVRRQELAIRSSLGGGRWRLTRQLLTEGLLLALAGGAVGLLLSAWATQTLLTSLHAVLPVAVSLPDVGLDWRVFLGTIAFCLGATLVFAVGPALFLTGRAADLKRHTGDGERRAGGVRFGQVLVIGQIALSLLLIASGGLFLMSVLSAGTIDPGFKLDGGLIVKVDPALAGYDEARGRQAQRALIDRLRTVPGVEAVTIGSRPPFTSMGDSREVAPAGAADAQASAVGAAFSVVGRDYARVLGLPMLSGRDFSAAEMAPGSGQRVAIIDDVLAQELWPGENALGRSIQFLDGAREAARQPILVVGIIPAVKHSLGNPRPSAHVYVPLGQHYESAMTLQLRVIGAEAEQRALLGTIAQVVRAVDERVPVLSVATWRDFIDAGFDVQLRRVGAAVFGAFGGIALLLAVLGVYGVKSYVVSRRTREFGIRIAIGARPRTLLWQVLREGGRVTGIGIAIGLLLALGAGQFLQGILHGVNNIEPVVLLAAPLILLAASLLASYLPALRATRVDPTVALRSE